MCALNIAIIWLYGCKIDLKWHFPGREYWYPGLLITHEHGWLGETSHPGREAEKICPPGEFLLQVRLFSMVPPQLSAQQAWRRDGRTNTQPCPSPSGFSESIGVDSLSIHQVELRQGQTSCLRITIQEVTGFKALVRVGMQDSIMGIYTTASAPSITAPR